MPQRLQAADRHHCFQRACWGPNIPGKRGASYLNTRGQGAKQVLQRDVAVLCKQRIKAHYSACALTTLAEAVGHLYEKHSQSFDESFKAYVRNILESNPLTSPLFDGQLASRTDINAANSEKPTLSKVVQHLLNHAHQEAAWAGNHIRELEKFKNAKPRPNHRKVGVRRSRSRLRPWRQSADASSDNSALNDSDYSDCAAACRPSPRKAMFDGNEPTMVSDAVYREFLRYRSSCFDATWGRHRVDAASISTMQETRRACAREQGIYAACRAAMGKTGQNRTATDAQLAAGGGVLRKWLGRNPVLARSIFPQSLCAAGGKVFNPSAAALMVLFEQRVVTNRNYMAKLAAFAAKQGADPRVMR